MRSPIVVPSSTISPSTWKNSEACDRVDRLVAVAAPRQEGPDRRRLLVHDPDLAGRRVGPQQVTLDVDVERVPQVARRVVGRDVQHLEVA